MRATIIRAQLDANRDIQPVYNIRDSPIGYAVGRTTYRAELELDCDREFWEALLEWIHQRRPDAVPELPSAAPRLPQGPVDGTFDEPLPALSPAPPMDFEGDEDDWPDLSDDEADELDRL